jgi:hypothetical protein
VPLVWPSPVVTIDVEAVSVAPTQDASSVAGRTRTLGPWVALLDS